MIISPMGLHGANQRLANTMVAVLWFGTTLAGCRPIRQRRFADHRQWMLRSVALAYSIVAFRLWMFYRLRCVNPRDLYRCRRRPSCLGSGDRSNELIQLGGQSVAHRKVAASRNPSGSAEVKSHHDAREPTRYRTGVSGLGETGFLKELARAHIGHGEVDLLTPVIHGIALDRGGTL